jgi:hypothetical protein
MTMFSLANHRRVVNLNELLIAVVVRRRNEQVELVMGREQRSTRMADVCDALTNRCTEPALAKDYCV